MAKKNYQKELRYKVLDYMGGKCVICGFTDKRALQIDHVHNDGKKDRKEVGFNYAYIKRVLFSVVKNEGVYQILCANCNWIKRSEIYDNKVA